MPRDSALPAAECLRESPRLIRSRPPRPTPRSPRSPATALLYAAAHADGTLRSRRRLEDQNLQGSGPGTEDADICRRSKATARGHRVYSLLLRCRGAQLLAMSSRHWRREEPVCQGAYSTQEAMCWAPRRPPDRHWDNNDSANRHLDHYRNPSTNSKSFASTINTPQER